MIATPFTESESELSAGATKRKRKRRRSPGGLGRGLARILTDSNGGSDRAEPEDSGLLQLVGGESSAKSTKVRKFVVDTALATLADAFGLDGLILATHSGPPPGVTVPPAGGQPAPDAFFATPTFLAATLPPSWSLDSQILFEVYGNLWRVLKAADPPARPGETGDAGDGEPRLVDRRAPDRRTPERRGGDAPSRARSGGDQTGRPGVDADGPAPSHEWHTTIGQHHVWMSRSEWISGGWGADGDDGNQPVAMVAIRPEPFSQAETQTLAAVIGSVVAACSETEALLAARRIIRDGTTVSLKSEGREVLAEVTAAWEQRTDGSKPSSGGSNGGTGRPNRRTGAGRASDAVTAVARAAAKACRPRCEITFAGATELDNSQVSVVMIQDAVHGLRLGFAVRPMGDFSGAAEAVFTAAADSQSG